MSNSDTLLDAPNGIEATEIDVDAITDAFSLLGEPVRLRILLALAGTRRANWTHDGLSYSDLRAAAGVEDGGRFNYHLDRLQDQFVLADGDRYRLTYAGSRIVNIVFDGTFGHRITHDRTPIDRSNPTADGDLEAAYDHGYLGVWPTGDDDPLFDMVFPPTAALDRSLPALIELASIAARQYTELATDGICPECWAELNVTVVGPDEPVRFDCDRCQTAFELPVYSCVVYHPRIAVFLAEHGYDVDDVLSVYELYVQEDVSEHGDDPVRVTFDVEGDRRTATLATDGSISVEHS